jgi:hypothetical protein
MIEEGGRTNRVSDAFRRMAKELERERQVEPPLWQRPPEARHLLRDLAVALLLALLVSAIGIAWIVGWE